MTLTREVDEALESEQLLGWVTAGQLANKAMEAAVRGQEGAGELRLGGQSETEVTELADGQLAALTEVRQSLGLFVRDLEIEILLGQIPSAGLRLQPPVPPLLCIVAVSLLDNLLHCGLHLLHNITAF